MPWQVSSSTPKGKLRGLARGVSRPTSKGEVERSGLWGSPGPHLGVVSRPTPRGVCLQAHTWGGLQAHKPGGVSRPTPGGVSQQALRQTPPMATAAGGTHPTGMHSCLQINLK